ncbi:superoxide dismutase [Stenotrophomonas sp. CFBP 13718]|uniref:superoxide dismutase n=1 Tax=Stenotrophomonas sp. CFBP 13718 TaxID=2775304 RepID=UPI001786B5CD|nr:superoxide dismutase [Stenotrophomonas sp. CFBP 13718]MBD8696759.1 superoxide dismutase [Stenotrophomonas sp. CFBP 13718]
MRRLALTSLFATALLLTANLASASESKNVPFSLPELPYANNALEPAIDARTMDIHHNGHHRAYVNNLNAKVKDYPALATTSLEDIQASVSRYGAAVRNNAGGHYNHSLFWTLMAPVGKGGSPSPVLKAKLVQTFGSKEAFQTKFAEAATRVFGSGWAWLILKPDGSLAITTTPNQDNPLMDVVTERGTPLLALDVWEHAYYLHYQNKRADYIKAWWPMVNWNQVNARYDAATGKR